MAVDGRRRADVETQRRFGDQVTVVRGDVDGAGGDGGGTRDERDAERDAGLDEIGERASEADRQVLHDRDGARVRRREIAQEPNERRGTAGRGADPDDHAARGDRALRLGGAPRRGGWQDGAVGHAAEPLAGDVVHHGDGRELPHLGAQRALRADVREAGFLREIQRAAPDGVEDGVLLLSPRLAGDDQDGERRLGHHAFDGLEAAELGHVEVSTG